MTFLSFASLIAVAAGLLMACGDNPNGDTPSAFTPIAESIKKEIASNPTSGTDPNTTSTTPPKDEAGPSQAPKFALAPIEPIATGQSYKIEAKVTGADTIAWTKVSGPGLVTFSSTSTATTNVTASVEGSYVLNITVLDKSGQKLTQNIDFQWDRSLPTIAPLADVLARSPVAVVASVSGGTTYTWSKLFGTGTLTFSAPHSLNTVVTASQDGAYVIRLTASNRAGNSSIRTMNFTWDTTAPIISSLADVYTQSSEYLAPSISGALSYSWTKESGPGSISFSSPSQAATTATATVEGTYILRMTAQDAAGNSSSSDVRFIRDTLPPQITAFTPVLARASTTVSTPVIGAVQYAWSKKSGPGAITFANPAALSTLVTAAQEGDYVLTLTATDQAANSASADLNFTSDTTAPTIAAMNDLLTRVTVALTPVVTGGAVSFSWTRVSGPGTLTFSSATTANTSVSASVDGTYVLRLTATDGAGNVQSRDLNLIWDATPPAISNLVDVATKTSITLTPTITGATSYAWSTVSGPATLTYGNASALSTSISATTDGTYVVRLIATDDAGNSTTQDINFVYDTVPPVVSPYSNVLTNTAFSLSPTVSGASRYAWTQKSGPGSATFTSPFALTSNVSASADGAYVLTLTATDAAGNAASRDINFTWDTTAPVATLSGKPAVATQSSSYSITVGSASADVAFYKSAIIPSIALCSAATYSDATLIATTLSGSVAGEGTYNLCVITGDPAGNWQAASAATTYTWTVDTTPPSITLATPIYAKALMTLSPTVTGATSYAWTQTGGTGTITFGTPTAASTSIRNSLEGTASIRLVASDAAGNSTTATASFIWDVTAPTAPVITGPAGIATGPITLTATLNETVQGLTSAKITITKGTITAITPSSTTPTTSYSISVTPTGTPMTVQLAANAVQDLAGNNSVVSNNFSISYDGAPPVAPEATAPSTAVSVDGVGYNTALAKWYWASDLITAQTAIKYYISYSTSSSFDSIAQVMAGTRTNAIAQSSFATANGCATTPGSTSQLCSYTLTGLTASTTYYVNVVAEDAAGNQSVYTKGTFTTLGLQPIFKKIAAAANGNVACGLSDAGLISCWGDNTNGALGDGSQVGKSIPTALDSSFKFVDLAVGAQHACAIRDNGNLYCWGAGSYGQLGNSSNSLSLSPTLAGSSSDIFVSIGAGDSFTCGLKDDGKAYCWGDNQFGQLGNSGTGNTNSPGAISGSQLFRRLSVGSQHSCGIKDDGNVYCWGLNFNGQIGNSTSGAGTNRNIATLVTGSLKFREIGLGRSTSCGLAQNGDAYCWGKGSSGQIGNSGSTDVSVPTKVTGTDKFIAIAAGANTSCAMKDNGTILCWGDNTNGELNTGGAQSSSNIPVASTDTNRFVSLVAGSQMFCGLRSSGASICWGDNSNGQLGVGDSLPRNVSAAIGMSNVATPTLVKFKKVVVGDISSCAISSSHDLWCWGNSTNGELGVGAKIALKTSPMRVGTLKWIDISLASNHVCGITDAYEAYCWGLNSSYELGTATGDTVSKYSPTKVNGTRKYISIATAVKSSCAAATDGQLVCWGSDIGSSAGNLANGTTYTALQVPTASNDTSNKYLKVVGGDNFYCGLGSNGVIHCWGRGTSGALGTGTTSNQPSPASSNFDSSNLYIAVSAGATFSCGVNSALTAKCFGLGSSGQMGNTTTTASNTTVTTPTWSPSKKVLGQSWSGAATDHSCVTTTDYYSYCWGANAQKQSANSATNPITAPTMQNSNIIATSNGTTVSCQLSSQGDISCFGFCDNGRCGQATPGNGDTQTTSGTPLALKVSGI